MTMKKAILTLGAMMVLAGSVAHAGQEVQYQPLLEELRKNTCVMKNGSFMKKAKATAKLKDINKRIKSAEATLKATSKSAYIDFKEAHAEALAGKGC